MVVYCVQCLHCNQKYVGQTIRPLRDRAKEHRDCASSQEDAARVAHAIANNIPIRVWGETDDDPADANAERVYIKSAIGLHHHRDHVGLPPSLRFSLLDKAVSRNQLDALERTHFYFGNYAINRRLEGNGIR
jgi:hypothetical protein